MVCYHSIVWPMVDNYQKSSKPMVAWPQNHRKNIESNFAMVAKWGPKSPKRLDYVFSLQNCLVTLKWSGGFIYSLSLSSSAFVRKWAMSQLQAFLGLSNGPKPLLTIVPEFGETIEKPSIAMVNRWKKHSMVMVKG